MDFFSYTEIHSAVLSNNQLLSPALTIGTDGIWFSGIVQLFPLRIDTKITFYRERTVVHWVEQSLSHATVCTLNTMSLISNLTAAL